MSDRWPPGHGHGLRLMPGGSGAGLQEWWQDHLQPRHTRALRSVPGGEGRSWAGPLIRWL